MLLGRNRQDPLAIALGVAAARHGHRVLFATATDWVTRLTDAHRAGRLAGQLHNPGPGVILRRRQPGLAHLAGHTVIAYDRTGSGPPLILVTGTFGYRKFPQTQKLVKLLSNQYAVYNYDRRGRGDSGDSGDSKPYTIEREIEDLNAVLDACGGTAYVFGLSSGAVLALNAASRLPNKIRGLAVYQPPFALDVSKSVARLNLLPELTRLVAATAAALR